MHRSLISPLLLLLLSLTALTHAVASSSCSGVLAPTQGGMFVSNIMDPASIPKWVSKVPNPLHPSNVYSPDRSTMGAGVDYFQIGMRQISQQILPPGCPATNVFAYGLASDPLNAPTSYSSPSKTIIAFQGRPTKVRWVHTQLPSQHLFPIDRTFHCGSATNCTPDVRTVVHLHGGHVESAADGFPEAWKAPTGETGLLYGSDLYNYANSQEGTTLWFHDHAIGITRLNVYAGLAGFYILRGNREMTLQSQNLIPRYPYDIPIVIQDRSFKPDGSLAYPDAPFTAPRLTNMNFGNVFVVNGVAWPKMLVEHRKYRVRFLNGCNSRFLSLTFKSAAVSSPTTLPVFQIGTDSGLLNSPVDLTGQALILAPAERADIIIDFSAAQTNEKFYLTNNAATPYPLGTAPTVGSGMDQVIMFHAKLQLNTAIPDTLAPPTVLKTHPFVVPSDLSSFFVRKVALYDVVDTLTPGLVRLRRLLGTSTTGGIDFADGNTGITETPQLGATEVWEIYNPTGETHPIHLHQTKFQILDRHDFDDTGLDFFLGNNTFPVLANEQGPKDTVRVDPNTAVRILPTFNLPGLFVWHCHILEHEDFDMMRPMCVGGGCNTTWLTTSGH